ncbi:MAG: DUF2162 domain-containing protein [Planctomycetota bacterium]|jgi:predicted transporter|nr:DUF2162 domain-containing protein [Planctomycetota bacterium]
MEFKTLLLGLVLSTAAFAVKTGLGWSYALASGRLRAGLAVSLGLILGYGGVFALLFLVLGRFGPAAYYGFLPTLWEKGAALHWLLAGCLFLWGLALLRRPEAGAGKARPGHGWLALVVPCPVCLSLLAISESFLILYFPARAAAAVLALFAAFIAIALAAAALARLGGRFLRADPEGTLGLAMLFVSSYFMLSALAGPGFAEFRELYGLVARIRDQGGGDNPAALPAAGAAILILFALGFARGRRELKLSDRSGQCASKRP